MKVFKELFNKFQGRFELVKNNIGEYNEFRDDEVYSSLNKLVELTNEAVDKAINNNDYDNKIFDINRAVVDLKEAFDKVRYARRRTTQMIKAFEYALRYAIKVFIVAEDEIELNKADKVSFNKSFEVKVNGLAKSYSITTEEVESQYGYTDIVCKLEAKSTVLIDGKYALIKAYVEVYDGVVTHVHIGRDNNHLQLESFLDSMTDDGVSRKVDMLLDDIKYEASSYIGEKDFNFAYSILSMVLNINSFDTNTYLINNTTYNLVDVA